MSVKCELVGDSDDEGEPQEEVKIWTLFVDELPMTARPKAAEPGPRDREVFASRLPDGVESAEELAEFLMDDFGVVEHVHLLKEDLLGSPALHHPSPGQTKTQARISR